MTYSIVARDGATGDLGVAAASRWFGVGSVVPWVEAGVGAVATQSFTEEAYGYHGLRVMAKGWTAGEALAELLSGDQDETIRQVGMVDRDGGVAGHTGSRCVRYASHLLEPGVTVQANMMERPTVPAAMLAAFEQTAGDLAARLLAALRAAEAEHGDVRGRQAAALVVAPGRTPSGGTPPPWARRFDLRVDDHRAPLDELERLLAVARAYAAMDEAEQAFQRGDPAAAAAAGAQSVALAPDDDQVLLWGAVGLALAGQEAQARAALARATAAEPRSGDGLRRFAEAGHLPGGDATLRTLGLG